MKKVGEVLKTSSGGTPLKSKKEFYENGNIPWLMSGEVSQGEIFKSKNYITQAGLDGSSAKLFPVDTVLVAMYGATAGQVGILKIEASTNQAVCGVFPNEKYSPEFVYYFFLSKQQELIDQAVGNAQPNISQRKIKDVKIPVIPLPEQHRLVHLLDTAFGEIERARVLLARNLVNAGELFESRLGEVYVDNNWKKSILGDVCLKIQDGAHHSPKTKFTERAVGLYPYVTSKNIRNNYMDLSTLQYVDKSFHETIYGRCKAEFGDVLLTKDGVNTGNVTLNEIDEPFSLLSSVCLIKTDKDFLNPAFLKYFIQSPSGFKSITGKMTGTAIKRIILRAIKAAIIPLPSVKKQNEVVAEFDSLLESTGQLKQNYQTQLHHLTELKQSLLARAFAGEL